MTKAVLICPGRGTYNAPELGYLARHFPDRLVLQRFDAARATNGQPGLSDLDGAPKFDPARHLRGDNAAALIFAASVGDAMALRGGPLDIVAVTGNSMGWYSALTCAGVLGPDAGFALANTMGGLMHRAMIGGQLLYPLVGADWRPDPTRKAELLAMVAQINGTAGTLALSIDLGGMLVLAGDDAGLAAFEAAVPKEQGRFPMRLPGHAAFHTGLQAPVAAEGRAALADLTFGQPQIPMIDGRGAIWWPGATDTDALNAYTLGHQVTEAYDFTRAIIIAAREFAPDVFVITGPGTTLGGAVAQSLILTDWQSLSDKSAFQARQARDPIILSMGMPAQRSAATG